MLFIVSTYLFFQMSQQILVFIDNDTLMNTRFEKELIQMAFDRLASEYDLSISLQYKQITNFQAGLSYIKEMSKTKTKNNLVYINNISYTDDRAEYIDFTQPYLKISQALMTLPELKHLHQEKELNRKFIYGVIKGSISETLAKNQDEYYYQVYETTSNAKEALLVRKIDFLISDAIDALELNLEVVSRLYSKYDNICIVLPKGSILTRNLNKILKHLIKSKEYEMLVKKYYGENGKSMMIKGFNG